MIRKLSNILNISTQIFFGLPFADVEQDVSHLFKKYFQIIECFFSIFIVLLVDRLFNRIGPIKQSSSNGNPC